MIPEDLDLAALSRELHQALGPGEPVGYLHFLGDPRAPSEAESRWDFRTG